MLDSPSSTSTKLVYVTDLQVTKRPTQPNYLLLIPDELLSYIFSFVSLDDIGMLCLTGSTLMRDRVVLWINSAACYKKLSTNLASTIDTESAYDAWIAVCRQFGFLCKRASMLCNTTSRLTFLSNWYSKLESLALGKDVTNNKDWTKLWGRLGLGAATSSFTTGWDMCEYRKVVEWVLAMEENILQASNKKVLRIFFWEFIKSEDIQATWLSYILAHCLNSSSTLTKEEQAAELLFCLFGPSEDDIMFLPAYVRDLNFFQFNLYNKMMGAPDELLMQEDVFGSYHEAKEIFSELSKSFRFILGSLGSNFIITESFTISVVDTLFNTLGWSLENQAACLLFTSERLMKLFLKDLVTKKNGRIKLSQLLVAMVIVCGKLGNDINQNRKVAHIVDWSFTLLKGSWRKAMIAEFWKEVVERIEEDSMDEDVLVQLGMLMGDRAYINGGAKEGGAFKGDDDVMEIEE